MKILVSLLVVFFSKVVFSACDFKPDVKRVVSLSGITTTTLKEVGLLKSPKLQGISIFNPVKKEEFKGEIFPGGIFLSQGLMSKLEGAVVFFDESRELTRIFKSRPKITSSEVRTRNLTPREAINSALSVLDKVLVHCENEKAVLKNKVDVLEKKIISAIPSQTEAIFYLGDFVGQRPPGMVMVQDGIVKWFIQNKILKTYPSDFAYVNWSSKMMNTFSPKTLHVGIVDSGREGKIEIKKSSQRMTFSYPGVLVPGMSQLEAFAYWSSKL